MRPPAIFSQRLLRKGPLVEDTYRLFHNWNSDESIDGNIQRSLHGGFPTISWEKEVVQTTKQRLTNLESMRPLISLARNGLDSADWRDCWRLWVGATEEPFGSFARDWLFSEFESGRHQIRAENARDFAVAAWKRHSPNRPLSDHGVVRMARDLVKTATDLGMLAGAGMTKTFAPVSMRESVMLFYIHLIADLEGSPIKVPTSPMWRLAYMSPSDVHAALLHLHQFRRLDYQIAGSLVQLTLPHSSANAFAESLAA